MNNLNQATSCYIHIPFCEHICYYCDFNKVFLKGQPVDEYIQALLKEMRLSLAKWPMEKCSTLYIGGGTPTALSAKQLDQLLSGIAQIFPIDSSSEYTIEANPGDLTQEKLSVIKNAQINRISMGVQSFNDRLLKKIGRKHTAADVYQSLKLLEKNQIANLSIDLIYALPNQTMADFKDSLQQALSFDLPHYALYSLILENQTIFMNRARRGHLTFPEQEEEAAMYQLAIEMMEKTGHLQYEISNFAKKGFESQHNLVYWNNQHYYGFGAGASGYLQEKRYINYGPIQHYLKPLRKNQLPIRTSETLSVKNQMEEEMFLGLRKKDGISLSCFKEKFAQEIDDIYGNVIESLIKQELLKKTGDQLSLTQKGLFLGNEVFEKFLIDDCKRS